MNKLKIDFDFLNKDIISPKFTLYTKRGKILLAVAVFLFSLIIFSLFFEISRSFFYFFLFLWFIFILIFAYLLRRDIDRMFSRNKELMRSFAKKNNFSFEDQMNISNKNSDCQLLCSGLHRKIFNILLGDFKGHKLEIYNFQHSFRSLKYPSKKVYSYEYLVFEIETKKVLPKAIISAKESYLSHIFDRSINLITSERLQTESNEFNKNFKIFLKRDFNNKDELAVLQILTPDIMYSLIKEEDREEGKDIHLEFVKNTILLYKSAWFTKINPEVARYEKDIQRLLNLALEVAEEAEK